MSKDAPKEPLIITYTNLLHKCKDPGANEVRDFLKQHGDDPVLRVSSFGSLMHFRKFLIVAPENVDIDTSRLG